MIDIEDHGSHRQPLRVGLPPYTYEISVILKVPTLVLVCDLVDKCLLSFQ